MELAICNTETDMLTITVSHRTVMRTGTFETTEERVRKRGGGKIHEYREKEGHDE